MSIIEKSNKVLKKDLVKDVLDHNGLNRRKIDCRIVTILFFVKFVKLLYFLYLGDKWRTKTRQKSPMKSYVKFAIINALKKAIMINIF